MEGPQFGGASTQILIAAVYEHLSAMYQSGVTPATSGNGAAPLSPHLPPRVGLKTRIVVSLIEDSQSEIALRVQTPIMDLSSRSPSPIISHFIMSFPRAHLTGQVASCSLRSSASTRQPAPDIIRAVCDKRPLICGPPLLNGFGLNFRNCDNHRCHDCEYRDDPAGRLYQSSRVSKEILFQGACSPQLQLERFDHSLRKCRVYSM